VEIATLNVEGIHKPLHICLHNLRETNLKMDRHFSGYEMATITACINIARQMGIDKNQHDQELRQEFFDFYPVELNYGSKEFKQDENHESNELSAKAMMEFARNFRRALKLIAENEDNCEYEFWELHYHQTRYEDGTKPERNEMMGAAQELMNGILFTATVAGIKKNYTKDKFQTEIGTGEDNLEKFARILRTHYQNIVKETNEKILEENGIPEGGSIPEDVHLFSEDPDDENAMTIYHVKKELKCFMDHFDCYYADLDKLIYLEIAGLCNEVDRDLRKKFNSS
jgi:hypothetical protein